MLPIKLKVEVISFESSPQKINLILLLFVVVKVCHSIAAGDEGEGSVMVC